MKRQRQRSEERRKFEEAAEFFKQAGNERSYAFALRDVAKTWAFDDSLSLARISVQVCHIATDIPCYII